MPKYKNLPDSPGVYFFKNRFGKILYIGKAGNLRRRVSSYFEHLPARNVHSVAGGHDARINKLVSQITKITYQKTDSALEALILEASLIKKHKPSFNIREKDDKSFLYVGITHEDFPRVLLVRGKVMASVPFSAVFGPFVSASSIREALRILRRIFSWNTHSAQSLGTFKRPCLDCELGLCPGTCIQKINQKEYKRMMKNLSLFFEGKKARILISLRKEMKKASKSLEFERAQKIRKQIFALEHIQDVALISDEDLKAKSYKQKAGYRIEGYDVSNISGDSAVGSMVVFSGDAPVRGEYRKFKIQTLRTPNDVGMLEEVLERRFSRRDWPLPDCVLVDGGKGQVKITEKVLERHGFKIPIVGIAKGPTRKKNEFIGNIPEGISKETLIKARNEAHRFAISYHRSVRSNKTFAH